MKIVFYSDNFYPELSGITDTILITGKELQKRGHEVVYVAPWYSKKDYAVAKREYPKTPADDKAEGLPIVRLPSLPMRPSPTGQSRFVIPFGASYHFIEEFKPDVIHTQSPYGTGIEARRAAERFGIPLVGTNHTDITDFFPIGMRSIMRRLDARYYNHCDYVTAPYQKLIERMREAGFTKPGHFVSNPAELSAFHPPADLADRNEHKRGLGLTGPVVLYCGRLGVEKRVDVIVRALPQLLKEFPTLTLVATGHGAAEAGLKTLAKKLRVQKNLRLTGFLSRKALAEVYQAADVFAFMSTSDSQSIALMQAYAAGVPAVCARARGLPDYTPEEAGFLVEPGDSAALAEKISLILRDDALRARLSAGAVAYAQRFAPATIADLWERVYQKVITRDLS
ncbi:glycosyltransferase [Candidatus Kaiserbacteria bacterium]|nr:glycosyltransferase [Candidatus Kaiserbacteria bacterium]